MSERNEQMNYSASPQKVYAVVFTHYYNNKATHIFGFVANPLEKTKDRQNALLDHLWERGFTDGLCLRV